MEPRGLLARLYVGLPVPVQDLAVSAWGYKLKRERFGSHFHTMLASLRESEWWSADEIRAYQIARLREVLRRAEANIPFYRSRFAAAGFRPDRVDGLEALEALPVLSKAEVRRHAGELVDPTLPARSLRWALTSGTTGSPLRVALTPEAQQFQWAVWWRHRARFGLRLGDPSVNFGARLPLAIQVKKPPFWRMNHAIRQAYLSTYHLTPAHMEAVVAFLERRRHRFFSGYPSAMYVLARYLRDRGRVLENRPDVVVTGSDALLPGFARLISEAFGAPVTDQYGSVEACGNFARCEHGRYHLDAEFGIVELLPVPGAENGPWRRIVCTGLGNPAMPLIRYDIGDLARLPAEQGTCPCGRASLTVEAIEGRMEDFVRTPEGGMATGMNQVFEWAPGIDAGQIRQDRVDAITVSVVPGPGFSPRDIALLERELRARLGPRMSIEYREVPEIPRTPAGKIRAVVSTLPAATPEEREHREAVLGARPVRPAGGAGEMVAPT